MQLNRGRDSQAALPGGFQSSAAGWFYLPSGLLPRCWISGFQLTAPFLLSYLLIPEQETFT